MSYGGFVSMPMMEDQRQIIGDVLNMEPEARGTSSHMFSPHVQSFSSLLISRVI